MNTREYVSILKGIVEDGETASMVIVGSSMSPFLCHERDKIWFRAPERELKRGDMVFFQRDNGAYVMHRICRVTAEGYDLIGDGQQVIEKGIRREQIFAIVTRVKRKGKEILPGDFWWRFFAGPWLWLLPVRPLLTKVYRAVKK